MWVSALAHCHKRLKDQCRNIIKNLLVDLDVLLQIASQFLTTFENVTIVADSNHGWKMIGVGHLIADEICEPELLEPFRFARYQKGKLHPVSNSPYPWS